MKYILFEPYPAGLANVLLSYEVAAAISIITNRILILPPKIFIYLHSEPFKKESFVDLWSILDKKNFKSYINCVDFYDVPELKNNYESVGGFTKYKFSNTKNASLFLKDFKEINFLDKNLLSESHEVVINKIYNQKDFNEFAQNRPIIDLSNINNKFIHFEQNLFGLYWYNIYPGEESERNNLKFKINKAFKYKNMLYDLASIISDKIGNYNAIHVRRGDFTNQMKDALISINDSNSLKYAVNQVLKNDLPLYISTDEENKNFFKELQKEYKIFFYEDFEFNINNLERAALEQIICFNANKFYGTYPSTFSKRINVMRGFKNKQADDDITLNQIQIKYDLSIANPWKLRPEKRWEWSWSSHPQWKREENGFYKNFY